MSPGYRDWESARPLEPGGLTCQTCVFPDLWRLRASQQISSLLDRSRDTSRILNTDSQWLRENDGFKPKSVNFSLLEDASKTVAANSRKSSEGDTSLHASMLTSDATSKWLTEEKESDQPNSSFAVRDGLLGLSSDSATPGFSPNLGSYMSQLRPHLGIFSSSLGTSSNRPFEYSTIGEATAAAPETSSFKYTNSIEDQSHRPATPKNSSLDETAAATPKQEDAKPAEESIEAIRDAPPQTDQNDLLSDLSELANQQSSPSGVGSSLIHKESFPCGTTKYTVWDIPNDRYIGQKVSAKTFFTPAKTSTPVKRSKGNIICHCSRFCLTCLRNVTFLSERHRHAKSAEKPEECIQRNLKSTLYPVSLQVTMKSAWQVYSIISLHVQKTKSRTRTTRLRSGISTRRPSRPRLSRDPTRHPALRRSGPAPCRLRRLPVFNSSCWR